MLAVMFEGENIFIPLAPTEIVQFVCYEGRQCGCEHGRVKRRAHRLRKWQQGEADEGNSRE